MKSSWLAAAVLAALPLTKAERLLTCDSVIVSVDCLLAVATGLTEDSNGVSVQGLDITQNGDDPCPKFTSARLTLYREKGGGSGFQEPPDEEVRHLMGDLGGGESSHITIGSFSSYSAIEGKADSWELTVETTDGRPKTFSGEF